MTDSSTEKPTAQDATQADEKKVPVAALAEERAQKRAARSEAEAAKAELAQAKSIPNVPDEVITQLVAEARRMVEAEVAPLKQRAERAELGVKLGLNEKQVNIIMDVKQKNPTLTNEQALLLARAEHQSEFVPAQSWNRAVHGGLPVTGTSEARNSPDVTDYRAQMLAAQQKGDRAGATHFATQAALQQFRDAFNSRPIR